MGVTGVVVAAALTTAVATAGSASADRVSAGYFPTPQGCASAGQNQVDLGFARAWTCPQVTNPGPHHNDYHLILFT
jgi:hypothetical protein